MPDQTEKAGYLADVARLRAGDVVTLLRVPFYAAADGWTLKAAIRMVAIVAMMALARIGSKQLMQMEYAHYRPDGDDVMVVTWRGVQRTIPLTPALKIAMDRYVYTVRPTAGSNMLFLSDTGGTPLGNLFYSRSFGNLERHLGADQPLKAMLRRFCTDHLDAQTEEDETVIEQFLHGAPEGEEAVSVARMRRLLTGCDPFDGCLPRAMEHDDIALRLARRLGTSLPEALRTRPSQKGVPRLPRLGSDHPFVAAMLAVEFPCKRPARVALAEELMDERGSELLSLLRSGMLTKVQGAELFHLSRRGFDDMLKLVGLDADQKAAHKTYFAAVREIAVLRAFSTIRSHPMVPDSVCFRSIVPPNRHHRGRK
jgi:hypothetical protein